MSETMDKAIERVFNQNEKDKLNQIKRSKNQGQSTYRWIQNILLDMGRVRFNLPFVKN